VELLRGSLRSHLLDRDLPTLPPCLPASCHVSSQQIQREGISACQLAGRQAGQVGSRQEDPCSSIMDASASPPTAKCYNSACGVCIYAPRCRTVGGKISISSLSEELSMCGFVEMKVPSIPSPRIDLDEDFRRQIRSCAYKRQLHSRMIS
jgi:hypothetical protein